MDRPVVVVLLAGCGLLLGIALGAGAVTGQDGGAERTLNTTSVSPGGTVEVTVTAELDETGGIDFADTWSPSSAQTEIVSTSFDRGGLGIAGSTEVALLSRDEVPAGPVEIVYTITVPEDADPGTVYEWDPAVDGDGSLLSLATENIPIGGDQQFTVVDNGSTDGTGDDGGDGGSDDGTGDGGDGTADGNGDDGTGDGGSTDGTGDDSDDDGTSGGGSTNRSDNSSGGDGSGPGFGFVAVLLAGALLAVYSARRSDLS